MLGPDFTGTYPSIVPEFFGDFILVNGMAWPKFDADPGVYRFHLLNGSDLRFFVLQPDNPWVKVTLIGSDGGLLPHAITIMDGDGVQEAGRAVGAGARRSCRCRVRLFGAAVAGPQHDAAQLRASL